KAEIFAEKFKNMPSEKRKASFVEHKVKKGETITHIASKYGVSSSAIVSANKIDNPRSIRTGMKLLIPLNKGSETLSQNKDKEPKSSKNIHIVKRGDTIIKIAQQHGLSVNEILRINNLNRSSVIRPGDTIFLSQESGNLRGSSGKMVQREKFEHIVKKGESLYSIARQYGVSIDDLVEWNELPSDNLLLRVGQKIFIMKHRAIAGVSDNREKVIYTVKKGDSLYKIAKMFGTTIGEIKRLNNLSTNRIKENQRIVIYKKKGIEVKKMVYVVRPGDTLWSIATSFGVSVESILKANGLLDPNKIKAGDELAIYVNE
ncbi:MAG: LysM peptidoglycan-binding domain-containing protein, partial [bacterium]